MSLFSRLVVGTAESAPVKAFVTSTRIGKRVAGRFVAGETLDDAIEAARKLNKMGMSVSLDLLGEEVATPDEVEQARREYEECLQRIASEDIDGNISIKLTQLGLSLDEELTSATLDQLAKAAAVLDLTITVDMEDSTYTASTVEIFQEAQAKHGNLGVALQAYLRRTPSDLALLAPGGGHLRLCKGAYVEPEEIAFTDKHDVDAAYVRLLEPLMADSRIMPAIATHDRRLVELTRRLARSRSAPFEFQMLYGVALPMQRELAANGYPLRIYVPYGVRWYPYLVRRLGERPANLGFFLPRSNVGQMKSSPMKRVAVFGLMLLSVGAQAAALFDAIESSLREDRFYIEDGVEAQAADMQRLVEAYPGFYFVALGDEVTDGSEALADDLLDELGSGTVVVFTPQEAGAVSSEFGDSAMETAFSNTEFGRSYAEDFEAFAQS